MKRRRHLENLDQDIRDHIEEETQDNIGRGMAPDEARQAALRKFGNILRVQEETREVWSVVWIEQLLQDVRYGFRVLRRNPAFTTVVILTLALGIGVNTAVFSVVNAVLLRPLPYPDAERVVAYSDGVSKSKAENFKPGIAGADFSEWRAQAKSFERMAGYDYRDAVLAASNDAGQVRVASIAGDFWAITGCRPLLGRLFEPAEPPGSIVLSHKYFERRFGGDPHVVGKAMSLDGQPITITGVLPADFQFLLPQARAGLLRAISKLSFRRRRSCAPMDKECACLWWRS
jgi:putative ABC transport system permease protein